MPTNTDLAYAAALIDGEGCISAGVGYFNVAVSMADESAPTWMHATFGGSLRKSVNNHQTIMWTWSLRKARKIQIFLEGIRLFSKTKRFQVEVGIELAKTFKSFKEEPNYNNRFELEQHRKRLCVLLKDAKRPEKAPLEVVQSA